MTEFDLIDYFDEKLEVSEGTEHVRESEPEDKKKPEGYAPHPHDETYYELMGIKNSFDNVSVASDEKGQTLISVNSQKEPGAPTLENDRKRLDGTHRKRNGTPRGEFYTNCVPDRKSAFAYRADKNVSDLNIYTEFKQIAEKKISRRQREAVPFLRLDEDRASLSLLRGTGGGENPDRVERELLEKRVRRETEYRDVFMARLRKARQKAYRKQPEPVEQMALPMTAIPAADTDEDETAEGADGAKMNAEL